MKTYALVLYKEIIEVDEHKHVKFDVHVHNVLLFDSLRELRDYERSDECRQSGCSRARTMMVADMRSGSSEGTCHALPPTVDRICTVTDISTGSSMDFGYWRCSECGMNNFEGARHCMGCGAMLIGESESPAM